MADSFKVRFKGEGEIQKKIQALSLKGNSIANAEIGFSAPYAARIHEDLTLFHPNGEAKFLEKAYRRNLKAARELILQRLKAKKALLDAMERGARLILQEAQRLVPKDTHQLEQSGYIRVR
jgi:hypothetical protein